MTDSIDLVHIRQNCDTSSEHVPDDDIDFIPDQWDDSELYPWDCDQGVPW